MIVENLQREDVHPIEEARAFQDMYDDLISPGCLLPNACIKEIAKRMGKTTAYITQNIILASLLNKVANAFSKNIIDKKIALEYAKLTHEDQSTVWESNMLTYPVPHHRTIQDLKRYIEQFKTRKMSDIIWDINDETFESMPVKGKEEIQKKYNLPSLPACSACPKNTGVNADLFGTVFKKDARCTDRDCFSHKKRRYLSITRKTAKDSWPFPHDFHEGSIDAGYNGDTIKITGGSKEADRIKGMSFKYSLKETKEESVPIYVRSHNFSYFFGDTPKSLLCKRVFINYPELSAVSKDGERGEDKDNRDWERKRKSDEIRKRRELLMLNQAINEKKDWTPHEDIISVIANYMFHKQSWQDGPKIVALYEEGDYLKRYEEVQGKEFDDRDKEVYPKFLAEITTMDHLQKLMYILEALKSVGTAGEEGYAKNNSVKVFISKVCGLDFKKVSRSVDKEAKQWYRETVEEGN